jgi:hypothetical protein
LREVITPPQIGPSGWALESAESRSQSFPETFLIPHEEERRALSAGQGVKLLFWIQSLSEHIAICERMWVLVSATHPDGTYVGRLESTPDTPGRLIRGERVRFGPEHIAEIFAGSTGFEASSAKSL